MEKELYTKKVIQHFLHPKNIGKIKKPDGVGKVGNIVCGDVMWIYIKVKNKKGKRRISDIKFQTFGCVAAISASSIITTMAKGKTLEDALRITNLEVANRLGGLPKIKMHCSVLASDALSEAIYNYLSKNKLPIPEKLLKRHERIKRNLEMVEKMHGSFVKFEEKLKGRYL